ncbi:MAG: Crp/Fnr family transcriptional regulator [Methylotenera sp.]|nr:Crp/Fnr family transcriptional regulator [Methylotenera sp.]MDP2102080.1 Crp/Fnr family transcriptional regulator [Methylotenera sp.]MDP2282404.1 Crp/Fnr family transcriptional regulator [Methylotenera sp.]MDP2404065.1 Crp/Fnr family transcriptional regulator [Methylotenera sp.]MDP3060316.1 Crp/Fnr family transcriptional regulator [Methylotenera sp.]
MLNLINGLDWLEQFPELRNLEQSAKEMLSKYSRIVEAPIGTIGYREGAPCGAYVMRLAGKSRVYKISSNGREILLYRVGAGETCVITTTCLLGNSDYPASTIVEEPIRDVLIPATAFHQLMLDSSVFRKFVMTNYGALISDLIVLLDEVAFHNLDARLAKVLLDANNTQIVRTHQQIADELGTAREVVSRQLKRLEQKGSVSLGRGQIEIINRSALEKIVGI